MILFARSAVVKTGTISVPLAMSCETQSTRALWNTAVKRGVCAYGNSSWQPRKTSVTQNLRKKLNRS